MSRAETVGFGAMFRAGGASLRSYVRLAVAVYAVQLAIATGAAFVMARMLAAAFARYPVFDEAVDGGAFALILVLIRNTDLFVNVAWVGLAAVVLYAVVSWFLVGGLLAVYLERPTSRVAAAFGAGAATSFFAFARLALWCIVPYGIGLVVMSIGLSSAGDEIQYALSLWDAITHLVAAVAPGAVVFWLSFAAVDYARVDLACHPEQSSLRALLRGYRMVVTGWRPLAHISCYYAAVLLVSAVYVVATFDQPMGAVAVLLVRQLVSMARFIAKLMLIAGQAALGGGRDAPVVRRSKRHKRRALAAGTVDQSPDGLSTAKM